MKEGWDYASCVSALSGEIEILRKFPLFRVRSESR